jgi:branched-chain amino acid transport system substrate-binding protein
MKRAVMAVSCLVASAAFPALAQDKVFVGHLADYTGATAFVGKYYGPGVRDAVDFINASGGVAGTPIDMETVDYSYKIPDAIANYKRWKGKGMVALQGWGTGDTEALIGFVADDKVPVLSASYSGHLTDPSGKNPNTKKPAPYNFFYGPSYTDACRAMVQWAAGDAKAKGIAKPKFIHTGDNHPYPNAPKEACGAFAKELGFEVLTPVVIPLKPGDFKAQCLTIKESGANYVFVGNLGGFPSASPFWDQDAPGMKLVRQIADKSGFAKSEKPTHHYIRGICSVYYMKEAMEWAKANGGINGENIKKGMYAKQDWVPKGLEGVCLPSTWTPTDHRGTMTVSINRGDFVDGKAKIEKIAETKLPREDRWLGQ